VAYNLFEYVSSAGRGEMTEWKKELDTVQRAKLQSKLNILKTYGPGTPTGLLAGTSSGSGHIQKLKVKGNVQLRPRLCAGPIDQNAEYSLLVAVYERDMKDYPRDANEIADARRLEIIANHLGRRRPYV
jgi:hypothetical protein